MRHTRLLLLISIMATLSGCYSYTTLHTATPVEKGKGQLTIAPQVDVVAEPGERLAYGDAEIMGRFGIVDDVDVGLKVGAQRPSFAFDFNLAIVNTQRIAFALDPYVSLGTTPMGDITDDSETMYPNGLALINILLDLKSIDGVTFMVGAKPGWFLVGSSDPNTSSINGFVAGTVTAVEIDVGDSASVMPGVDLLVPFAEELPGPLVNISFAVKVGS